MARHYADGAERQTLEARPDALSVIDRFGRGPTCMKVGFGVLHGS